MSSIASASRPDCEKQLLDREQAVLAVHHDTLGPEDHALGEILPVVSGGGTGYGSLAAFRG